MRAPAHRQRCVFNWGDVVSGWVRGFTWIAQIVVLVFLSSCTDDDPPRPAMCDIGANKPVIDTRAFVVNGTATPSLMPLTAAQVKAVVAVSTTDRGSFCSGALIKDDVVVTAGHCTRALEADGLFVIMGEDETRPLAAIAVVEKIEHPTRDVALLRLSVGASSLVDVAPIPIDAHDLGANDLGAPFEQAGYGRTETEQKEGRRFVVERVAEFQGPFLVVDGLGEHGVCSGDSGGPSLRITRDGDVRVVGVLSFGDSSCRDKDRYTRTDLVRDFIESVTGPTPMASPVACASSSTLAKAVCAPDRSYARRCRNDVVEVDVCGPDARCVVGANDAVCVSVRERACGQETSFGRCEGEALIWCDERTGDLHARDCGGCNETCAAIDRDIGFACVPQTCGPVDDKGQCQSDIALWCVQGRIVERDCLNEGFACADVDDFGVECVRSPLCDTLGHTGRCTDGIAEWCTEDGRLVRRDCESRDQVCAFIDDNTGFYCVE